MTDLWGSVHSSLKRMDPDSTKRDFVLSVTCWNFHDIWGDFCITSCHVKQLKAKTPKFKSQRARIYSSCPQCLSSSKPLLFPVVWNKLQDFVLSMLIRVQVSLLIRLSDVHFWANEIVSIWITPCHTRVTQGVHKLCVNSRYFTGSNRLMVMASCPPASSLLTGTALSSLPVMAKTIFTARWRLENVIFSLLQVICTVDCSADEVSIGITSVLYLEAGALLSFHFWTEIQMSSLKLCRVLNMLAKQY